MTVVPRTIAEVAGIKPEEILYFSPSNRARAHLPYMIALDKCAALLLPAPPSPFLALYWLCHALQEPE